jgi:hypothetical protein
VLEIEKKDRDGAFDSRQDKAVGPKFCERCQSVGHIATDCMKAWPHARAGFG